MKGSQRKSTFNQAERSRSLWDNAFDNTFVQLSAFILFVFAIVFLVTADSDHDRRMYAAMTPGSDAPIDVLADRSFVFAQRDEVEGAKRKKAAASEVPLVYDWQEGLGETLRNRVHHSFTQMRDVMLSTSRDELRAQGEGRLLEFENKAGVDAEAALIDRIDPARRIVIARSVRKETFDKELGLTIRDSDFTAFARDGFSEITEGVLTDMLGDVMTNILVPSQRVLDAERVRGIFLRRMRGDRVLIEYHVKDISSRFVTMERVPGLVDDSGGRRLTALGDRELRNAVASIVGVLVQPNTFFNQLETVAKREEARQSVSDFIVREEFRTGQLIVAKGEPLTAHHIRIIELMLSVDRSMQNTQRYAGVVVLLVLLLVTMFAFGQRNIRKFRPERKDILFMSTLLLFLLMTTRFGMWMSDLFAERIGNLPPEAWYYLIPVAASGMFIRLIINSEHAVVFTLFYAIICGFMADVSLFFMAFVAVGGLVGAGTARQVKNRMALMWSGLVVGGINVLIILAFQLIHGQLLELETFGIVLIGFGGGLLSGLLVSATLPMFEAAFGYTTDVKLLELANLNHPALRELIMRAPGSYHHSMMVGSLCESAAEAIGCNPLLARVGSYYHDIGKARNPGYFAENQKLGMNPHDKLKPNMSALIIKAHVKDGIEMARQYRLPKVIEDFIAQHHGTSLIAYFYHRAKQLENPGISTVNEKDYRYPGPKPQTRETAICLLADGIEAASRAMPDPTPARLKGLVQKMINKAFTDGQLDECELTLKDLNLIAEAFNRILTGIYHHRPEYPGDKRTERIPAEQKPVGTAQKKSNGNKEDTDDVWELTQESARINAKEEDAAGSSSSGKGDEPSKSRDSKNDSSDESRQSLPRLGSS